MAVVALAVPTCWKTFGATSNGKGYKVPNNVGVIQGDGINVVDLGVNVEHQAFVDAIRQHQATLVGMSCLLTTVFDDMRETISSIDKAGLREQVTVLIGGGPVDQATCDYVGADVYCRTAQDGVAAAKRVLGVS